MGSSSPNEHACMQYRDDARSRTLNNRTVKPSWKLARTKMNDFYLYFPSERLKWTTIFGEEEEETEECISFRGLLIVPFLERDNKTMAIRAGRTVLLLPKRTQLIVFVCLCVCVFVCLVGIFRAAISSCSIQLWYYDSMPGQIEDISFFGSPLRDVSLGERSNFHVINLLVRWLWLWLHGHTVRLSAITIAPLLDDAFSLNIQCA